MRLNKIEENPLMNFLVISKMWRYEERFSKENVYVFNSNMRGFSSGRYRIEIQQFKRKFHGFSYRIFVFWTPYNPDNLVYKGLLNSVTELKRALKNVNEDLLDISRVWEN